MMAAMMPMTPDDVDDADDVDDVGKFLSVRCTESETESDRSFTLLAER